MTSEDSFYYCYTPHRFSKQTAKTVEQANAILEEMRQQGYVLTLRQLYYQFVRRNWIANTEKEYKRLGTLVTRAREAGIMNWLGIEDRGRTANGYPIVESPEALLKHLEMKLLLDPWKDQEHYIEVWVEKQALESVISRPCRRYQVNYMACKGYLSASEAWRAGLRFQRAISNGKQPVLIHLADHDPSGLDMTTDNNRRVNLFAQTYDVEIRRIALNMDQVQQYNPPPNPAKEADSRAEKYVKTYGPYSWELDALEPKILDDLIANTVEKYIDYNVWAATMQRQAELRNPIAALSSNWNIIQHDLRQRDII